MLIAVPFSCFMACSMAQVQWIQRTATTHRTDTRASCRTLDRGRGDGECRRVSGFSRAPAQRLGALNLRHLGSQNQTTNGPQVLVFVSNYMGSPHPFGRELLQSSQALEAISVRVADHGDVTAVYHIRSGLAGAVRCPKANRLCTPCAGLRGWLTDKFKF